MPDQFELYIDLPADNGGNAPAPADIDPDVLQAWLKDFATKVAQADTIQFDVRSNDAGVAQQIQVAFTAARAEAHEAPHHHCVVNDQVALYIPLLVGGCHPKVDVQGPIIPNNGDPDPKEIGATIGYGLE